ncbi:MAG: hypothetical protein JWN93_205 [Hyphomicrobiales bacterium]|nr:hypothetical protein [Hyphomicrobiales bacterium]
MQGETKYYEDFHVGDVMEYGAYEMTRDEIVAFATAYDPQPFHLDEEAGRASILGGLAASGWHTASAAMRLHADHLLVGAASLGSPGIEELRWLKPVRPGDVLSARITILDARPLKSRPGVGLVRVRFEVSAQGGELKMTQVASLFIGRRDAADAPASAAAKAPVQANPVLAANLTPAPADCADDEGVMSGWYDDLVIGRRLEIGEYVFGREEALRFAAAYDPQPFHLDEAAAAQGLFGGLSVSGWHTAAACMARLVATRRLYTDEARRRGLPEAPKGPSPGFRDLKWLRPVLVGDTVSFSMTLADKRPSSRAGWGMVFNACEGVNQRGEKVYEYMSSSLWPFRRQPG